jgi:hypothetical protein
MVGASYADQSCLAIARRQRIELSVISVVGYHLKTGATDERARTKRPSIL